MNLPDRDGRVTLRSTHPVRINLNESAWAPMSTFGTILTGRDEFDLYRIMMDRGNAQTAKAWIADGVRDRVRDRDRRIIKVARRWSGDPLRPPAGGSFVAGDVAAMRTAVAEHMLDTHHRQRAAETDAGGKLLGTSIEYSMVLDMVAEHWLYTSRSYFVGAHTLVGLVDCEIPTDAELDDLRLPADQVVIYFGGDLTIPAEITGPDDIYTELIQRIDAATPDDTGHIGGDCSMPSRLPGPLVSIYRNQPVQMCGVALRADADGRLDDVVMWLVSCPEHQGPNRYALYGRLSRSLLRYVAVNLAAAIAWGQWTPPSIDDLPEFGDPRFRDVIRSSRFRKAEPHGGALGVHVLDVRRTMQPSTRPTPQSTHASPSTHTRRAHWKRMRVGPRDDWHYERRFIARTIVNPGFDDHRVTVYRLPPPSSPVDGVTGRDTAT